MFFSEKNFPSCVILFLLLFSIESFLFIHFPQFHSSLVLHLHLVTLEVLTTTIVQFFKNTLSLGRERGGNGEGTGRERGGNRERTGREQGRRGKEKREEIGREKLGKGRGERGEGSGGRENRNVHEIITLKEKICRRKTVKFL